jgi:hypothetical protein
VNKIKILISLILLSVFVTSIVYAQTPSANIPIPQNCDVVIWLNGQNLASDTDLEHALIGNQAIDRYLNLVSMSLGEIEYAVLFMPFSKSLVTGRTSLGRLPANSGLVMKSFGDWKTIYKSFKTRGWKASDYSNKKVLWWSTGETYFSDPKTGECVALLQNGTLAFAGSESFMRQLLDVSGGKQQGLPIGGGYQVINDGFFSNPRASLACYAKANSEMRSVILADTASIKSETAKGALEYVDHISELGINAVKNPESYQLNGILGMDSDNNALVVSSLLQLGGGLANLLPQNDPNRAALSNMTVSRDGHLVKLSTSMTKRQIIGLIRR